MITSFFSKSKPINFIIVFFIMVLACIMPYFKLDAVTVPPTVAEYIVLVLANYFSVLLLNFIVGKNGLTKSNTLEILLYGLFILLIPATTSNLKIVLSNVFILFGLRRLISLQTQKEIIKKLFDAGFWIAVASLLHVWSSLFFLLIPYVIVYFTDKKLRYWLIPLSALACVFIIAYSFCVVLDYRLIDYILNGFNVSLNFTNYNTVALIIAITLLFSFSIWASLSYIKRIKEKKKSLRPIFYFIILLLAISFLIMFFASEKNGSEFLFIFAPLTIILTNYIETLKKGWFKEVFLLILIIVPFVLILL